MADRVAGGGARAPSGSGTAAGTCRRFARSTPQVASAGLRIPAHRRRHRYVAHDQTSQVSPCLCNHLREADRQGEAWDDEDVTRAD